MIVLLVILLILNLKKKIVFLNLLFGLNHKFHPLLPKIGIINFESSRDIPKFTIYWSERLSLVEKKNHKIKTTWSFIIVMFNHLHPTISARYDKHVWIWVSKLINFCTIFVGGQRLGDNTCLPKKLWYWSTTCYTGIIVAQKSTSPVLVKWLKHNHFHLFWNV